MTPSLIVAVVLSILGFVGIFLYLGIVSVAVSAIDTSRAAFAAVRDPALDEDEKERAAQQASLRLFGALWKLVYKSALALLGAIVPVLLMDAAGLVDAAAVTEFLSSWQALLGICVLMLFLWIVFRRLWPSQ